MAEGCEMHRVKHGWGMQDVQGEAWLGDVRSGG